MHVREMNQVAVAEMDKYIIIDTHGGEQDILGLVVALQLAKKYDKTVLGITCVVGRNPVEVAVQHALTAQQIAGTSIPIFKGAKHSLLLSKIYPPCYNLIDHSKQLTTIPISKDRKHLVQSQFAPVFIAEQIRKHSQELCIITFGPLTNLAIAFHQTQQIKILSSVRINGGASSAAGNVIASSGSQGNFHFDPQSAHIVISNYSNVYLNPIEKTLQTCWKDFFIILKKSHAKNFHLSIVLTLLINREYSLCGPLITLLPAFSKQTVPKVLKVYSEIMTKGTQIIGMTASNWLRLEVGEHEQAPNTKIYSKIDLEESRTIVQEALDGV